MGNKKFDLFSIILLSINSIIGTGIFLTPGSVAKITGTFTPFAFLGASIFAMIAALTFARASRYVSENGAAYSYSKAAFGHKVGSYVGVNAYVAISVIWSVTSTGVVKVVHSIFNIPETFLSITIGLFILVLILYLINIFKLSILVTINNLSTLAKSGALIITILAGLYIILTTKMNNMSLLSTFKNSEGIIVDQNMNLGAFVTAVIAAFYAFTGFETIASGAKDMENPEKNLPRAIPISILIVALVYMGVVVVAMMINPLALVQSKEVVILASVFDNPILKNIIVIGALISMFGINVAYSFHIPRILEALANNQVVPKYFAKRNKHVSIRSFIATILIVIGIAMSFNYKMDNIMVAASISAFVQYFIVPLALIVFYFGKSKFKVNEVKKNFSLDVVISILAMLLTILLVVKFDWYHQFTFLENEVRVLNIYAVISMLMGFIILPVFALIYQSKQKQQGN